MSDMNLECSPAGITDILTLMIVHLQVMLPRTEELVL